MQGLENFFHSLSGGWGYVFLFFSALGENVFPPMPGDTFTVLGAFMVGRGQLKFLPVYLSTTAGSILGFILIYFVGTRLGKSFYQKKSRFFPGERIRRVELWFDRYGFWVVAVNRFMAGFRAVVSLTAGIVGYNFKVVFGLGLLSCLIWNAILVLCGIWVGENFSMILENYKRIVFGFLFLVILIVLIRTILKKRQSKL